MIQKMKNRKGFTLIEMLVVIAIIAVLVAIVVPTVSDSTEKAKEAADAANIRSAIAEVTTKALTQADDSGISVEVTLKQTGKFEKAFNNSTDKIGEFAISQFDNKTKVTVSWDATNDKVTIS